MPPQSVKQCFRYCFRLAFFRQVRRHASQPVGVRTNQSNNQSLHRSAVRLYAQRITEKNKQLQAGPYQLNPHTVQIQSLLKSRHMIRQSRPAFLQQCEFTLIIVVWAAGARMIKQGTDGLSRGDLFNGVLAGDNFTEHIPLNRAALELSPVLEAWLQVRSQGRNDCLHLILRAGARAGCLLDAHLFGCPPAIAAGVLEFL
jgi:hypothetical protein